MMMEHGRVALIGNLKGRIKKSYQEHADFTRCKVCWCKCACWELKEQSCSEPAGG